MQSRVDDKAAKQKQEHDLSCTRARKRATDKPKSRKPRRDTLESVTCRIGDNSCAKKHVSAARRVDLFHPMNEPQKIATFTRLQRQYGNRFTQRIVSAYRPQDSEGSARIQTKLKIGQPGDKYEQEADRVAEQVMRVPGSEIQLRSEGSIPAKTVRRQALDTSDDPGSRIDAIRGSGKPLPEPVRALLEPCFGYDLSRVRIHTDTRSNEVARAINARSFTVGGNIVFGARQYAPETTEGKRLLAHELTHTIQQGAAPSIGSTLSFGGTPIYSENAPTISREGECTIRRNPDNGEGETSTSTPSAPTTATPSAPTTTTGPCGDNNSCSAERCSELRDSSALAIELVQRAKTDLQPGRPGQSGELSEQTRTALLWHFRTGGEQAVDQVWRNFDAIERRLNSGLGIFTCSDPRRHCYALWIIPAVEAYTYRSTTWPITLCPSFFGSSTRSQAVTIIHEAGHNTGLPRAPFEREVYVAGHEYRALSSEEALVTTDAYANFARDNRYGARLRVAFSPGAIPELRTGVAFTGGRPQWMLSYGYSLEFRHPALSIINPVAGMEFTYIPALGEASERAIGSATIGTRIAARGQRAYFDLRAGAFYGREAGGRRLAGIVTEASGHFQPGRFDMSLFWRNHHSLIEGNEDTMIIGVGAGFSFP